MKQQIEDRHDLQSSKRLENYDDLSPSMDAEREELGISSSLLAVWRQRDFVWQALYVGLLFSTIIAFWITPEYESTTRIMPPEKQNIAGLAALVGNADDKLSALASDAVGLKSSGALYIGILNSRTVQDRLVERFDLKRLYGVSLLSQAREILSSRTQVSEDRKSGIIAVTVSDPSPARARDISGAYVQELNRLTAELSTSAARREREFLEGRLLSVRVELDQSSKQLSEFSSQNVTFDPKEQGKATFEAAAKLQAELISAQAQLSGLEQIYAPQNVRVRAVRAKIAELQRQLNSLASGPEKNGSPEVESSYPSLRKLPGLGVTYYNLYRDVKIQESIFEVLTKQLELAKVQEAKEVPTIRVLDAANLPESKASPKRLNLIILGCILSLLMSSIYLMVAHRWSALSDENAAKAVMAEIRKNITLDNRLFSHFARLPVVRSVLGRRLHWKRMSS